MDFFQNTLEIKVGIPDMERCWTFFNGTAVDLNARNNIFYLIDVGILFQKKYDLNLQTVSNCGPSSESVSVREARCVHSLRTIKLHPNLTGSFDLRTDHFENR